MSVRQSSRPNGRKRAAHLGPERRRPLVLDAAYRLFLEHGFEGTSMDSIAQAAGVSKPVVYDCFASKDELFTAMLDREEERARRATEAAPRPPRGATAPAGALIRGSAASRPAGAETPETYRAGRRGRGGDK